VRVLRAGVQKTLQQITAGPQGDGADAQQVFFAENKKRLTAVHEHYESVLGRIRLSVECMGDFQNVGDAVEADAESDADQRDL
jgi:hypothetical protein